MPLSPVLTTMSLPEASDGTAACAHGTIDWQPFGAHGNLHGGAGTSGAAGESALGA